MKKLYLLGLIPLSILLFKLKKKKNSKHLIIKKYSSNEEDWVLTVPECISIRIYRNQNIYSVIIYSYNKEQDCNIFNDCKFINCGFFEITNMDIFLPCNDHLHTYWQNDFDITNEDMLWNISDVMSELMEVYKDKEYELIKNK